MSFGRKALFPQAYRDLNTEDLLLAYDEGPSRMRAVLEGLDEAALRARPIRGKWSIKEIALHVADSEINGAFRVRQAFAQPGSESAAYDQDNWAVELDYISASRAEIDDAIALLGLLRRTTARVFVRLDEEGWRRTAIHPELGSITVRQLLELYADHTERHVAQILDRRRMLGKPLRMRLLLPHPLY